MPYSVLAKNAMLNALGALAGFVSLHDDAPGETGAHELTGGSPAYARKAITWNAAAAGVLDDSNQPTFDVPAGASVRYVGLWSAATDGIWYGFDPVTTVNYIVQSTYTLMDMDLDLNM